MLSLNHVRKAHKQERFPRSAEFKDIYWPTVPGQLQQQVWEDKEKSKEKQRLGSPNVDRGTEQPADE